jgi:hypothetical protein
LKEKSNQDLLHDKVIDNINKGNFNQRHSRFNDNIELVPKKNINLFKDPILSKNGSLTAANSRKQSE